MGLDRSFRLVGRAWTLRYGTVGEDPGTVGDYIDDLGLGQVVVLDNQGRRDATVWGDLLTTVAAGRGVAGTVIDGVCRDVDRSIELGYPIFSRGNWMRTGKDRVRVEEIGGPCLDRRHPRRARRPAAGRQRRDRRDPGHARGGGHRRGRRDRGRRTRNPRRDHRRSQPARRAGGGRLSPPAAPARCARDAGARGAAAVTRFVNQIANRHKERVNRPWPTS